MKLHAAGPDLLYPGSRYVWRIARYVALYCLMFVFCLSLSTNRALGSGLQSTQEVTPADDLLSDARAEPPYINSR